MSGINEPSPKERVTETKPAKPGMPSAMRLAGAGLELAATLVGACLLGYWIDRRFGTDPWGLLICAGIGIVGGLYNLIRRWVHGVLRDIERSRRPPEGRDGNEKPSQ
jgi:F0F1-type ATP synthase assembly protein I